jgi:membrane fusion protein, multidrug efflux system
MPQAPTELRQESFLQEDARRTSAPNSTPQPPPRRKAKPLLILTTVLIIAGIIGATLWLLTRGSETTDDAFIDGHIINVSPRISAEVIAVHFTDNQEVKKGDLLVELDPRDFNVALEKAQAQLTQAQAQVEQVQAQYAQAVAQYAQAQAQQSQQTAQFEIADINFNRNSSLYQQDMRAVSKQDVDSTKSARDAQQATVSAAKASVDAAQAAMQAAKSQIGSAQAAVNVAESTVDDAQLQLSYTRMRAPEAGRITRKTVEIGNYVTAGQTLFSIVQHDVWVTANFKEIQLQQMKIGQPVTIKIDAFPGRELKAHIDSFQLGSGSRFSLLPSENATGNYVKIVQRVPVKILFDEPLDQLLDLAPGMSAVPKVNVAAEGNADKAPGYTQPANEEKP